MLASPMRLSLGHRRARWGSRRRPAAAATRRHARPVAGERVPGADVADTQPVPERRHRRAQAAGEAPPVGLHAAQPVVLHVEPAVVHDHEARLDARAPQGLHALHDLLVVDLPVERVPGAPSQGSEPSRGTAATSARAGPRPPRAATARRRRRGHGDHRRRRREALPRRAPPDRSPPRRPPGRLHPRPRNCNQQRRAGPARPGGSSPVPIEAEEEEERDAGAGQARPACSSSYHHGLSRRKASTPWEPPPIEDRYRAARQLGARSEAARWARNGSCAPPDSTGLQGWYRDAALPAPAACGSAGRRPASVSRFGAAPAPIYSSVRA